MLILDKSIILINCVDFIISQYKSSMLISVYKNIVNNKNISIQNNILVLVSNLIIKMINIFSFDALLLFLTFILLLATLVS